MKIYVIVAASFAVAMKVPDDTDPDNLPKEIEEKALEIGSEFISSTSAEVVDISEVDDFSNGESYFDWTAQETKDNGARSQSLD